MYQIHVRSRGSSLLQGHKKLGNVNNVYAYQMAQSAKPAFPELYTLARERTKRRVARWPSAYASAQLVREYKALVVARHGSAKPYERPKAVRTPLAHWFNENWVNISTMKPCGSVKSSSYYPVCRPSQIARRLTPTQIADAVARKQLLKTKIMRHAPIPHTPVRKTRIKSKP